MTNILNIKDSEIKFFQESILTWYARNGRHFSWRNKSASNYEVIIAEIFLQRTKAETVAAFLPSFYSKYPSWKQLGGATEEELKLQIKPLGLYNQRGRRLFNLAQKLKERNGHFPKNRDLVEEMPMMGQYISNAFELYILKKPSPLLDVNMARVLERFFGPRKLSDIRYDPYLQELANSVVNHPEAKDVNWSILDLGSLVCKSRNYNCSCCPLNQKCNFYMHEQSASLTKLNSSRWEP